MSWLVPPKGTDRIRWVIEVSVADVKWGLFVACLSVGAIAFAGALLVVGWR